MLSDKKAGAAIAVSDIERAKKFYRDVLGLKLTEESPGGITFECGGGTFIEVYPSQFAGTAKNTVAGWRVNNLEADMEELRGRGVVFDEFDLPDLKTENGIAQLGPMRACWFKDPDGNTLGMRSG